MIRQGFGRAALGAGWLLGGLILSAPTAHADNCSSLGDCFYTVSAAAQVIAGVSVLVAATALALPALLRASKGPAELEEAGAGPEAGAPGQTAQGQTAARGQQGAGRQSSGTRAGGDQGQNLPNLPDTPDVPGSPQLSESLGAAGADAEMETGSANDAGRARQYTPQALEQMRALGVSPAAVEEAIRAGEATPGPQPGTTTYASRAAGLAVFVEIEGGRVLAVWRA